MKQKNPIMLKKIEEICKKQHIMEKYYGVEKFNEDEPYFTTSQEADIIEMISDGFGVEQIINTIQKW